MPHVYSDPQRESDTYALHDIEIFQLTATEVAAMDDDLVHEYMKRHEHRFASMNSRDRENMLEAMVEEEGIKGGWFYWSCFPGCLPDGPAIGPYDTYEEAEKAAQEDCE